MAQLIRASELASCVELAARITAGTDPGVRTTAFSLVLRELLAYEYVDDLEPAPQASRADGTRR